MFYVDLKNGSVLNASAAELKLRAQLAKAKQDAINDAQ